MAMGYKPLINNFPCAEVNWPSDCIFSTTDELIDIIQNSDDYDSKGYHDFAKDRYSLKSQLESVNAVLVGLNRNLVHRTSKDE